MEDIKQYLDRYICITPPDATIRRCAIEAIQSVCGGQVDYKKTKVIYKTLYIEGNSIMKAAIFIKKQEILMKTASLLGSSTMLIDIQ